MTRAVEHTTSLWSKTGVFQRERPPLREDLSVDVCIVGAGIAGMTTAYLLSHQGKSVVVLDDGPIGGGQTERTTAHLSNAIDDWIFEIEGVHGEEGSRLAVESHAAAIDRIESIVKTEEIDCDFQRLDGYLFDPAEKPSGNMELEFAACTRAGLRDVQLLPNAPLPFATGQCIRFPRQGQFHPLAYLAGMTRACERRGARIFTGTHVSSVDGGPKAKIKTEAGSEVTAGSVVVATNTPMNDWVTIHTKQAPYLTYAISLPIPRALIPRALYWDTLEAYHYLRLQSDDKFEFLIVGGEDHKSGQAVDQKERFARLEEWARQRLPEIGTVHDRWSGMVMETTDGLAFIGHNPLDTENVYIATGDSGMGITHGTIAGILLSDLIQGRENPWSRIYDPARKPAWGMAWKQYLAENVNVGMQYVRDWLSGGDVSAVEEIKPGSGAVLRDGLTKVAVYRDDQGRLHKCSAICPHLDCIVHWNDLEKSWDCPCHGSRFSPTGALIMGPANGPLGDAKTD